MSDVEYVVIGGGVAGLCAAMRLSELGISPVVIEGGSYPSHKVCGEFLSPSSLPILQRWGVPFLSITHLHWSAGGKGVSVNLPQQAGSLSHLTFDPFLARSLSHQGCTLLTETKVVDLKPMTHPGDAHILTLSSGEILKAKHLLIATGRLPGLGDKIKPRYRGMKAHFQGLDLEPALHMHAFKEAYLGIVPVENGDANIACLATIEQVEAFPSTDAFMQHLIDSDSGLHSLLRTGSNRLGGWMEALVPDFGWRTTPHWPQTYWIGDAAVTVPPASGNGLAFAIASGVLAAEFASKNQPEGFRKGWRKACSLQVSLAKGLHRLFLSPSWSGKAVNLCRHFPRLAPQVFSMTRLKTHLRTCSKSF